MKRTTESEGFLTLPSAWPGPGSIAPIGVTAIDWLRPSSFPAQALPSGFFDQHHVTAQSGQIGGTSLFKHGKRRPIAVSTLHTDCPPEITEGYERELGHFWNMFSSVTKADLRRAPMEPLYFPMQKVEKMRLRTSSGVVSPVRLSRLRREP